MHGADSEAPTGWRLHALGAPARAGVAAAAPSKAAAAGQPQCSTPAAPPGLGQQRPAAAQDAGPGKDLAPAAPPMSKRQMKAAAAAAARAPPPPKLIDCIAWADLDTRAAAAAAPPPGSPPPRARPPRGAAPDLLGGPGAGAGSPATPAAPAHAGAATPGAPSKSSSSAQGLLASPAEGFAEGFAEGLASPRVQTGARRAALDFPMDAVTGMPQRQPDFAGDGQGFQRVPGPLPPPPGLLRPRSSGASGGSATSACSLAPWLLASSPAACASAGGAERAAAAAGLFDDADMATLAPEGDLNARGRPVDGERAGGAQTLWGARPALSCRARVGRQPEIGHGEHMVRATAPHACTASSPRRSAVLGVKHARAPAPVCGW